MKTIREFRLERDWTQLDLAMAVGVTPGAVYKWESGTVVPDIRRLRSLASAFGVRIEDIALVGIDVDRTGEPIEDLESKIAA